MRHFPQKELCRFWKDDRFHRRDEALTMVQGFPGGASGREPACQCRRCERCGFSRWVWKIWRRAWHPSPVIRQRRLAGCRPVGRQESDRTEVTAHRPRSGLTDVKCGPGPSGRLSCGSGFCRFCTNGFLGDLPYSSPPHHGSPALSGL